MRGSTSPEWAAEWAVEHSSEGRRARPSLSIEALVSPRKLAPYLDAAAGELSAVTEAGLSSRLLSGDVTGVRIDHMLARGSVLESQLAEDRAHVHAQVLATRLPPRPENTPNVHLKHRDGDSPVNGGRDGTRTTTSTNPMRMRRHVAGASSSGRGAALQGFFERMESRASRSLLEQLRSDTKA